MSLLLLGLLILIIAGRLWFYFHQRRHNPSDRSTESVEHYGPPASSRVVLREVHTVRFLRFSPGAFFRLLMLVSLTCGLCYGLFLSVLGMSGGRVSVDFFVIHFRGEEAIVAAPFLSPILFAIFACPCCLPAWWITNWLLRRTGGVDVAGTIANTPQEGGESR